MYRKLKIFKLPQKKICYFQTFNCQLLKPKKGFLGNEAYLDVSIWPKKISKS